MFFFGVWQDPTWVYHLNIRDPPKVFETCGIEVRKPMDFCLAPMVWDTAIYLGSSPLQTLILLAQKCLSDYVWNFEFWKNWREFVILPVKSHFLIFWGAEPHPLAVLLLYIFGIGHPKLSLRFQLAKSREHPKLYIPCYPCMVYYLPTFAWFLW